MCCHTVPHFVLCEFLFSLLADGEDSTVSIQIKLENEGSDEELETDMLYSPQLALKLALTEWLGEFCVPRQYNGKINPILYCFSTQDSSSSMIWIFAKKVACAA